MLKFIFAVLLYAGAALRADSISAPVNGKILAAAQDILTNVHETKYSHKTEIDIKVGKYFCDCSGLGNVLLKAAAPESYKSLPIEKGYVRPRAVSFYSAFTNAALPSRQVGWQQVKRVADAEPGDFIAWRKPIVEKGKTSGHVMIVFKKPALEPDGSYRVEIMDSTSTRHSSDSRPEGQTGVGTGTMWFSVDDSGAPTGYRWSERQTKPTKVPLAIGRVVN